MENVNNMLFDTTKRGLGLWCSTPLSTIFQLYCGGDSLIKIISYTQNLANVSIKTVKFCPNKNSFSFA